jgi:hypothetical protein
MALETAPKRRRSVLGACLAGAYLVLVIAVYVLIASVTKPDNVGLDWIPFVMLAMPWYALAPQLLIVGFIVNAAILYFLGAIIEIVWRSVTRAPRTADR